MSIIVVDTSVIIAVILNEPEKDTLIELTRGSNLIAPHSLHWEVGNALSAMFKKDRITLKQAILALKSYEEIPIRFDNIDLKDTLELSKTENIYAYDAYMIICAIKHRCPLLSLDTSLTGIAKNNKVKVLEV